MTQKQQPMVRIMAKITFGGGGDPDATATDLERAGYKVNRMPEEYRTRMDDDPEARQREAATKDRRFSR